MGAFWRGLRVARLSAAAALVLLQALASSAEPPPRVAAVEPLGTFSTNARAWGRDAGYSARIGARILWIFGDTFTPSGLRSATGAWARPPKPFALQEAVDEHGAPHQFYPFSSEERAYAAAHATPPACCSEREACTEREPYCHCPAGTDCSVRVALWPGDVIEVEPGKAINFYEKVIAGVAPYDFRHVGTGLARIEAGSSVAARAGNAGGEPLLLFTAAEPNFLRAVRVEGEPASIFVFAATSRDRCSVDVLIGRVAADRVERRGAYRFWNGSFWQEDLREARPILARITGGLGSVAWNDHLKRYVAAFSDICTGGTKLHVRSAARPEGPWSEPAIVDLAPLGATAESYAGMLHPALGGGREMVLSFYRPQSGDQGSVRLARLRFEGRR
jgi:hypothetical protein